MEYASCRCRVEAKRELVVVPAEKVAQADDRLRLGWRKLTHATTSLLSLGIGHVLEAIAEPQVVGPHASPITSATI